MRPEDEREPYVIPEQLERIADGLQTIGEALSRIADVQEAQHADEESDRQEADKDRAFYRKQQAKKWDDLLHATLHVLNAIHDAWHPPT